MDESIEKMKVSMKICHTEDSPCFFDQHDKSGHFDVCRCYDMHPWDAAPLCKGKHYVSREKAIEIIKKDNGRKRVS